MAGKISSFSNGIDGGGSRATAVLTTNTRVKTARGFVGLVTDAVTFPDGTGMWFLPNQRVLINGVPTIGSSSAGIYVPPSPEPPVTMMVVEGDPKTDAM